MARIEGKETLALERDELWRRLNDPEILGRSIPGCSGFERIEDGRFRTSITVAVGPVRGTYDGTVEYRDVEQPERCTIAVAGRGDKGSIEGQGAITLEPSGAATEVAYSGTFKLTGPVAGVGQRLAPGVSRRMIVDTLKNLEVADSATPQPPAAAKGAEQEPPPQAEGTTPAATRPRTSPAEPTPRTSEFRPMAMPGWATFALGVGAGVVLTIVVEALF
jgi:carbon monoxide dehydrogenase subunit G